MLSTSSPFLCAVSREPVSTICITSVLTMTVTEIADDFGEDPSAVSWGITVTLMLRSVGALVSGSLSDRCV